MDESFDPSQINKNSKIGDGGHAPNSLVSHLQSVQQFQPAAFFCLGSAFGKNDSAASWITLEIAAVDGLWPPQFIGFLVSVAGMVFGSLLPQRYGLVHHHSHSA